MTATTHVHFTLSGQPGVDASGGTITAADPDTFMLASDQWRFGGVTVSQLTSTAVEIRTVGDTRDPVWPGREDTVSIVFLTEGDFRVAHDSENFRFAVGSAAYLTDSDVLGIGSEDHTRLVIVTVPLEALREVDALPPSPFGGFAFSTSLSSPLLSFAQAVIDVVSLDPIPAEPTASVLIKLVAQLFRDDSTENRTESSTLDLGLRLKADSLIAFHSQDRSFGALPLARQLELTLEQLEANFRLTGSGETPQEAIRDRRIMMAVLGLQSPAENARTSRDIAERAGFGVVKELHKALRAAYGLTIRQVLRGQIAPVAAGRRASQAEAVSAATVQQSPTSAQHVAPVQQIG